MQVLLIVANEHRNGQAIPVNVPSFMIGRAEGCNLRSRSPSVSRYHCTIQINDGIAAVQDLGGENGTFVNGSRVTSLFPLKNGDKLAVGTHMFIVSIKEGTATQEANQDNFFELTPASAVSSKSEESGTHPVDANMKTIVMQSKKPAQEPEVMFEIRLDGQRVSVTKSRLFELARRGSVTPDDLVTVDGTKIFADSIQGIIFGNKSSVPPPPPPPQPMQAPATAAKPAAPPESDPFAFPDIGDIGEDSSPFDDIVATSAVRVARRESAFGAIWKALDISFSRVYTMEGNNLVIHSLKALYYVLVVVCLLGVFWIWFETIRQGIDAGEMMATFSKHFIGLAVVTFGCITIIVVVRILIEMLLLAWLESASQEEQENERKK